MSSSSPSGSNGPPVVEVEDLEKSYGEVRAVRGISFSVPRGGVVGFLGPNGAGKTTVLKILTGFLGADAGSARVCGFDLETAPREAKRRLGYLPENNPLYPELRVGDFLAFAARAHGLGRAARRRAVDRVVVQAGLEAVYRRPIGECSKGFRQRVGLAQALLHDPPLLLLDEPTNGLDPNQVIGMREEIRRLGKKKTVILTSHVLPEVEAVADRVVLLSEGRKVADAPLRELTGTGGGRLHAFITIRGSRKELAELLASCRAELLEERASPFGPQGFAAAEICMAAGADALAKLSAEAAARGLQLVELAPRSRDLETMFRRLTRPGQAGEAR